MTNSVLKKTIIATFTVATVATSVFSATHSANAGSRDFWRGAAVGAVTGIVVGSAVRNSRRNRVVVVEREPAYVADGHAWNDEQHVNWCYRKYNSYDERTDTFQPFNGPRRYCNSPYN